MIRNLLIPCSGPGTRSSGYTKFHKALIRVGNKAVIDHIIDSYTNIDTIYVMLGYNSEYIRDYLEHSGYSNIEYIDIANWSEGQIPSFQQLPKHVFDSPVYYNACDNWSLNVPEVNTNTFFTCTPRNASHYDTDGDLIYGGISFIKDADDYYRLLQSSTHNRNDLLVMKELDNLQHCPLDTWYDVGNRDSYQETVNNWEDPISVLDKVNQEVYFVNNRVVKLWDTKPDIQTDNIAFPHPGPVIHSKNGLSYPKVDGVVNVMGTVFEDLFDSLENLWSHCLANNISANNKSLWQDKTWQRFTQMCEIDEKYSDNISVNGLEIDSTSIFERMDWNILNNGVTGPCHGDLTMDNIIMSDDQIHYIDHRAGCVTDIFYDISKFYLSLFLNCQNLSNLEFNDNTITLNLTVGSKKRIEYFRKSYIYQTYKDKLEVSIAVLCLCMAPLNVDKVLNNKLWLFGILSLHNALQSNTEIKT